MRDEDRQRAAREGLAKARAALGRPSVPATSTHDDDDHSPVTVDRWAPAELTARMAEGALRDELAARVTALEHDVAQLHAENERLRRALAEVASAATHALAPAPKTT